MKHKKKLIVAGIVIVFIIGAILKSRSGKSEDLPVIRAVPVALKSMEEELTATGQFVARSEEHLICRVNSRILDIPLQEGDLVQQGDLLIQLDRSELEKQLQQQQITLKQVELSLKQNLLNLRLQYKSQLLQVGQFKDKLERSEKVHDLGSLSAEELRMSRDSLSSAQNSLESLKQQLNLLCGLPADAEPILDSSSDNGVIASAPEMEQQQLAIARIEENIQFCSITAGMSGRISSLPFSVGTLVSPGMELALIQDGNSVEAEIWIDEVDIGKIHLHDPVEIEADSIIGVTLQGTILSISPRIERIGSSLASRVRVSLESSEYQLRPGGSCRAVIYSLARKKALTVPIQAVKPEGGDVKVYRLTAEGNKGRYKLEEILISTGLSTLDEMEILSGLNQGDMIAVSEVDNLRNGMVVLMEEDS